MTRDSDRRRVAEPVDWTFWRLQTLVKDWEAAALSLDINPDSMRGHRDAWMMGSSRLVFDPLSFKDAVQEADFDKRYRLAEVWGREHDDRVRYFNSGRVELRQFSAWLAENGLTIPEQLRELASMKGDIETPSTMATSATCAASPSPQDAPSALRKAADPDQELSELFDPVGTEQLENMFKTDEWQGKGYWKKWADKASENGLIDARMRRGQFNPYRAAQWWLKTKNPKGWDWARCIRTLSNNLPPRSRDSRGQLTGEPE